MTSILPLMKSRSSLVWFMTSFLPFMTSLQIETVMTSLFTTIIKLIIDITIFFSIPRGQVTVLVVGGALEAANSDKDCLKLVLNRRKGFIKLALRFGVDLVPTFSFGEYSIYDQVPNPVGEFWSNIMMLQTFFHL